MLIVYCHLVLVIGVFAALIWRILTHLGIPISATHALAGGLVGSRCYTPSVIICPVSNLWLFIRTIGAIIERFFSHRESNKEEKYSPSSFRSVFGAVLSPVCYYQDC
jgi:hypothetical protein